MQLLIFLRNYLQSSSIIHTVNNISVLLTSNIKFENFSANVGLLTILETFKLFHSTFNLPISEIVDINSMKIVKIDVLNKLLQHLHLIDEFVFESLQ